MHDDLGERLLQAGVITQAQLTSLQLAPNTTGGALIRDVLRLGVQESAVYAFFERRGYGPPAEGAILAARDASLGERIPRSTVTRLLALPLSRVSGAILTAMADPSDRAAVAELAHRLDSPIRPVLARVSDLERLIQEAYGDGTPSLPVRRSITGLPRVEGRVDRQETPAIDLVQRRASDAALPLPGLPLPPGVGSNAKSGDSSSTVDPIIPLIRPTGTTAPEIPSPEPPHRPTERGLARPSIPTERGLSVPPLEPAPNPREPWPRSIAPQTPAARSSRPPGETAPRSSRPPPATERDIKFPTPVPPSSTERDFLSLTGRRPSIPAFSSMAGGPPVPIESSLREIARATDRDAVLRAACHATATVCRSAVFLARRRDLLIGWEGAGVGISRDAIRNLWLPISGPSVFRDALSRARDYIGPPGTSSVDCVYRAVTGSHGGTTLIRPIMLRGKVIALLAIDGLSYGDHGTMRVTTVVNAVVEAFERIILANKAAGRPSEPPIAD